MDIVESVARATGIPEKDIRGPCRQSDTVRARYMVVIIAREKKKMSLKGIGRILGNRDHTTIIYAIDRAKSMLATDALFASVATQIMAGIEPLPAKCAPQKRVRKTKAVKVPRPFLSPAQATVFAALSKAIGHETPTNVAISKETGLNKSSVASAITEMENKKAIDRDGWGANRQFCIDGKWTLPRAKPAAVQNVLQIRDEIVRPEPTATCFRCGCTSLNPCRHLEAQGYRRAA